MSILEQLLTNGLIVFGVTMAVVLLATRKHERSFESRVLWPELRRAVISPVLSYAPATLPTPAPLATDLTERLLAGFSQPTPTVETAPRDRAALLRELSVGHLKASHPAFQAERPHSLLDGPEAAASYRLPSVKRQAHRSRPARLDRAPLRLVRPAFASAARPLQ